MKKKTAELFFMLYMKITDTENAKRLIIALLTDTDEKTQIKKLCNTVSLVQNVNSDI